MRSDTSKVLLAILVALTSLASCPCDYDCSIVTRQVPPARVGLPYETQLQAHISESCDFTEPKESIREADWSVRGGSLPPGLQLAGDGRLAGIPTIAGEYRVSIAARCSRADIQAPPKDFQISVGP
jgi:hypothetical protein